MQEYGYISVEFPKEVIGKFQKITNKNLRKSDFYYSEAIGYIHGDVSSNLHLTLFYGLINERIDKDKMIKYLKQTKIKSIELGKVELIPGYKNLYQILAVKVKDKEGGLRKLSESFKKFSHEESVQILKFNPHLTLAYVKAGLKIKSWPLDVKKVKVKAIRYMEK